MQSMAAFCFKLSPSRDHEIIPLSPQNKLQADKSIDSSECEGD